MSEPIIRLTRAQVREIDRRSIEHFHLPGIVLMENAARAVVDAACALVPPKPNRVLIACGGGNNGGDGLAIARHLHNRGVPVFICPLVASSQWSGDAKVNWDIVAAMHLKTVGFEEIIAGFINGFDLIIDAVFGTGLTAEPRPPFQTYVRWLNQCAVPILSVDLPSGMDCDSGIAFGSCVQATQTVTFVAEKAGFANRAAREYTGEIIIGDIGCPRELIGEVLREVPAS